MWATSSLSEVQSLFSTLANAKASIQMLIGYGGQLELIGSGEPILNVGQCESLHGNIYESM